MIHTDERIIKPATFQLLRKLQSDEELSSFFLVGGTSLALQLGHRHSIDLDMFSQHAFDDGKLLTYLDKNYKFYLSSFEKNTVLGFVDDVKVDFIAHEYELVHPLVETDGVRMASLLDVGAMKLNAISHSGQRQKDFYDMYFLLEKYSLSQLLAAYEKKYPRSSPLMPLRATAYFGDIEFDVEPPELIIAVSFDAVRERLTEAVQNPDKIF
jgi:hypothetical protein